MLRHKSLKNTEISTHVGRVKFDEKGEAQGLSDKDQETLGKLRGFSYTANKEKQQEVKEEKQEEKEKKKKVDKKTEEAKKEKRKDNVEVDSEVEDPKLNPKKKPSKTK